LFQGLKVELMKYKEKTTKYMEENQILKQKITDTYERKKLNF
jgi:hypothetical protein